MREDGDSDRWKEGSVRKGILVREKVHHAQGEGSERERSCAGLDPQR